MFIIPNCHCINLQCGATVASGKDLTPSIVIKGRVPTVFVFIFYCAICYTVQITSLARYRKPKYVLTKQNQLYNLTIHCLL